jgi:hypothetical protein
MKEYHAPNNDFKDEAVNIQPGVGMYALFPAMTYKPWVALGELVDNSIDSYVRNREKLHELDPNFKLRIEIQIDQGEDSRIVIEDNAAGIAQDRVKLAFTPASPNPDLNGIGRFGIGMKSATGWYSSYYTISSAALGESIRRTITFDIGRIVREKLTDLQIEKANKDIRDHGTRIVMSKLNKPAPQGQTLGKLKRYLASMYREFLRNGTVEILVAGEQLTYEVPELLVEPYWPDSKGPMEGSKEKKWIQKFSMELRESWESDSDSDRPPVPQVVQGWVGILQKGDNRKSGLALTWRGKVIYGAGSMAEDVAEEVYRPYEIYKTRSANQFLRLIGEIDVSDLRVSAFKDRVDWKMGQEEELISKLIEVLNSGEEPLLPMAMHYRATYRGTNITEQVEIALNAAGEAVKEEFAKPGSSLKIPPQLPDEKVESADAHASKPVVKIVEVAPGEELLLEVIDVPSDNRLISVKTQAENYKISFNRAHPFVNSFASLPDVDLDPVLRFAIAIGISEIRAKSAGIPSATYYRQNINDLLHGALSTRIDDPE